MTKSCIYVMPKSEATKATRKHKNVNQHYSLISMRLIYYFDTWAIIWHCSSISEDLHRFARNLQHLSAKLFLLLFLNNFTTETLTKTIFRSYAANFLEICANLQKSWNNMMSNDSFIIEYIDLSHIHLAVFFRVHRYDGRIKKF